MKKEKLLKWFQAFNRGLMLIGQLVVAIGGIAVILCFSPLILFGFIITAPFALYDAYERRPREGMGLFLFGPEEPAWRSPGSIEDRDLKFEEYEGNGR